jgi:hypothetical protein
MLTCCLEFAFCQNPNQTDIDISTLEKQQEELLRKEKELLENLKKQAKKENSASANPSPTPKETLTQSSVTIPSPTVITQSPTPTITVNICDNELQKANLTIGKLKKELDEVRSRLAISETEVERLAYLLDDNSKKNPNAKKQNSTTQASTNSGLRVREPGEIQAKVDQDMTIATVVADKAQLRTGPGMNNSPLMTVAKGTRLAVETRSGSWYRVIAPSGARAWVSSDVIDFGGGIKSKGQPSFARNPGLTEGEADIAESAAFEAIIKGAKKQ